MVTDRHTWLGVRCVGAFSLSCPLVLHHVTQPATCMTSHLRPYSCAGGARFRVVGCSLLQCSASIYPVRSRSPAQLVYATCLRSVARHGSAMSIVLQHDRRCTCVGRNPTWTQRQRSSGHSASLQTACTRNPSVFEVASFLCSRGRAALSSPVALEGSFSEPSLPWQGRVRLCSAKLNVAAPEGGNLLRHPSHEGSGARDVLNAFRGRRLPGVPVVTHASMKRPSR